MAERQGPAAQTRRQPQFLTVITAHQPVLRKPGECLARKPELLLMGDVAIERYALAAQMKNRLFFPVIAVQVREDDGADSVPGSAHGGQARPQLPRTQAGVDQQSKLARL